MKIRAIESLDITTLRLNAIVTFKTEKGNSVSYKIWSEGKGCYWISHDWTQVNSCGERYNKSAIGKVFSTKWKDKTSNDILEALHWVLLDGTKEYPSDIYWIFREHFDGDDNGEIFDLEDDHQVPEIILTWDGERTVRHV